MNRTIFPLLITSRHLCRSACLRNPVKDRYMNKLLGNKKKRKWHDNQNLESSMKMMDTAAGAAGAIGLEQKKTNPRTLRRTEHLSFILYRYITDMIYSGEVDKEIIDAGVQITKVRLLPDMTGVNVTWTRPSAGLGVEEDVGLQQILDKNAGKIRSSLTHMYIMSRIPKITFVKDKYASRIDEVEHLLKVVDMGPVAEENEDLDETLGSDSDVDSRDAADIFDKEQNNILDNIPKSNVLGLDHAGLMKNVIFSKNKSRDRSFQIEENDEEVSTEPLTEPIILENISSGQINRQFEEKLRLKKLSKTNLEL